MRNLDYEPVPYANAPADLKICHLPCPEENCTIPQFSESPNLKSDRLDECVKSECERMPCDVEEPSSDREDQSVFKECEGDFDARSPIDVEYSGEGQPYNRDPASLYNTGEVAGSDSEDGCRTPSTCAGYEEHSWLPDEGCWTVWSLFDHSGLATHCATLSDQDQRPPAQCRTGWDDEAMDEPGSSASVTSSGEEEDATDDMQGEFDAPGAALTACTACPCSPVSDSGFSGLLWNLSAID